MKSKILKVFLTLSVLPTNVFALSDVDMTYNVAEEEGRAVFHLDTSSIVFSENNFNQNINYHITTEAGNYYENNSNARNVPYYITAQDSKLKDKFGETLLDVNFDYEDDRGLLDLTKTVNDNNTYNGSVETSLEYTKKAGDYFGKTTILFNERANKDIIPIRSDFESASNYYRAFKKIDTYSLKSLQTLPTNCSNMVNNEFVADDAPYIINNLTVDTSKLNSENKAVVKYQIIKNNESDKAPWVFFYVIDKSNDLKKDRNIAIAWGWGVEQEMQDAPVGHIINAETTRNISSNSLLSGYLKNICDYEIGYAVFLRDKNDNSEFSMDMDSSYTNRPDRGNFTKLDENTAKNYGYFTKNSDGTKDLYAYCDDKGCKLAEDDKDIYINYPCSTEITSVSSQDNKYIFHNTKYDLLTLADNLPNPDKLGDLDGNGIYSSNDLNILTNYLEGKIELSEEQMIKADITLDGKIDYLDYYSLISNSKKIKSYIQAFHIGNYYSPTINKEVTYNTFRFIKDELIVDSGENLYTARTYLNTLYAENDIIPVESYSIKDSNGKILYSNNLYEEYRKRYLGKENGKFIYTEEEYKEAMDSKFGIKLKNGMKLVINYYGLYEEEYPIYVDTNHTTVARYEKGDVDGDNFITAIDSTMVNSYILKQTYITDIQEDAADINNNGKVDGYDYHSIDKYLSGYDLIPMNQLLSTNSRYEIDNFNFSSTTIDSVGYLTDELLNEPFLWNIIIYNKDGSSIFNFEEWEETEDFEAFDALYEVGLEPGIKFTINSRFITETYTIIAN